MAPVLKAYIRVAKNAIEPMVIIHFLAEALKGL